MKCNQNCNQRRQMRLSPPVLCRKAVEARLVVSRAGCMERAPAEAPGHAFKDETARQAGEAFRFASGNGQLGQALDDNQADRLIPDFRSAHGRPGRRNPGHHRHVVDQDAPGGKGSGFTDRPFLPIGMAADLLFLHFVPRENRDLSAPRPCMPSRPGQSAEDAERPSKGVQRSPAESCCCRISTGPRAGAAGWADGYPESVIMADHVPVVRDSRVRRRRLKTVPVAASESSPSLGSGIRAVRAC